MLYMNIKTTVIWEFRADEKLENVDSPISYSTKNYSLVLKL